MTEPEIPEIPAGDEAGGDPGPSPDGDGGDDGGGGANGTPYATVMLRRLRPPEHGRTFWSELDSRLADEPQLRLAPRAAIRPITQPPPVIDDRNLASSLAAAESARLRPRGTSRRTLIVGGVLAALAVLIVLAALGDPDETKTAGPEPTTNTSAGRAPTSGGAPAATTAPPTTVAPGKVDPAARLDPAGVGPLRIGATLGQLQAAGVALQPDQSTFRGTGGRCYNALVTGALDLRLRFTNPPDRSRADDPTQGVLAAIDVRLPERPSARVSNTGIGLGANQLQVLAAYAGNLDERDDPFIPGGKIYRAASSNGLGIAYDTDGQTVIGIAVGDMEVIKFVNSC